METLKVDPIIIIGAGLGGLAFAQGLRKASVPFKVFERGRSIDIRNQGYRIRLISEGVAAFRSLVTDDIWQLFEETSPRINLGGLPTIDAVSCNITQANFGASDPRKTMEASEHKPYNADRAVLREVLLAGLEDHIVFEKEYSRYEITDSGVDAYFADGTMFSGSLIVGADGARSAVRRQYLPHFRLLDTKDRMLYGKTPLTPSSTSQILAEALERLSFIKDQIGSFTLIEALRFLSKDERTDQRELPADYMYWVIIPPPGSVDLGKEVKRFNREEAVKLALKITDGWHPSLRAIVEHQDPSQTGMFGLLSVDPASLLRGWESNGRVTVLGDAAHAMLPSEANGTGTALRDGALLVELIKKHGVGLSSVAAYEEEMRKYAHEAVAASAKIGTEVFGLRPLDDAVETS
ncbi:MAG: hypothetical protein Q9225_003561 [Loekoesia sp. 1 TL-2023]